jgi:hypothetical protein
VHVWIILLQKLSAPRRRGAAPNKIRLQGCIQGVVDAGAGLAAAAVLSAAYAGMHAACLLAWLMRLRSMIDAAMVQCLKG